MNINEMKNWTAIELSGRGRHVESSSARMVVNKVQLRFNRLASAMFDNNRIVNKSFSLYKNPVAREYCLVQDDNGACTLRRLKPNADGTYNYIIHCKAAIDYFESEGYRTFAVTVRDGDIHLAPLGKRETHV